MHPLQSSALYQDLSYDVTRVFSAQTLQSPPAATALQLIVDRLRWDVGAVWIVNDLRLVIECAYFYSTAPPDIRPLPGSY